MEKRVFLAIFLSLVVLTVYQAVLGPPPRPEPAAPQTPAATGVLPPPGVTPAPGVAPPTSLPSLESGAKAPAATGTPALVGEGGRDVIVDTDAVRAVFSTAGATLKHWKLKKYRDGPEPLELVPQNLPNNLPRPFTLSTDDAALTAKLATGIYETNATEVSLGAAAGAVHFLLRDAATGLNVTKSFHFQPDGHAYIVRLEASADVKGVARPVAVHWGPALASGIDPTGYFPRAIFLRAGNVERLYPDDLRAVPAHEGAIAFGGVEDHYFLSVVVPSKTPIRIEYLPIAVPIPGDPQGAARQYLAYSVGHSGAVSLPFFMGPKEFDTLRAVDPVLVDAIDFGMFAWLVVPLLQALKWVNQFLGNWGWSIAVLTVLINLAIFPLRHRSMVSMRKMQALQPEVKSIQERYAKFKITDPERQKMNQEMMALYKQKGVNPASGCFPMLLTMPVLFAFYAMLSVAIELRGAPFFGWIHDLSVADPYWIWPILMGGTMFWQQKMTPTNADPVQQKIFLFLPLVFTAMFLAAPAGLVIYWLVSNLMAIGQQYVTNRLLGGPVRPAPAVVRGVSPARKPAAPPSKPSSKS
jgi:YidC/Oxa1 family membrane protein insertase